MGFRKLLLVIAASALVVSPLACGGGTDSNAGPGGAGDAGDGADVASAPDGGAQDGAKSGDTRMDTASDTIRTDAPATDVASSDVAPPECADDDPDRCAPDGSAVQRCDHGEWRPLRPCGEGNVCRGDPPECVPEVTCTPGTGGGCQDDHSELICDESGHAFLATACPEGELCFGGGCQEARCVPGSGLCMSPDSVSRCLDDGQSYGPVEDCPVGTACVDGSCYSECQNDPKFQNSYVGCVFWSTDLGQWYVQEGQFDADPDASHIPHAVIVGNPGERDAAVAFEVGDGTPVDVPDPLVPAGETRAFVMPELSLQETGVSRRSIRMTATQPVTAAQFNPPNNEDFVHTSDASLLLPAGVLGFTYVAVSGPSMKGLEMPGMGQMPSVFGYVTVVAVKPGETRVVVTPSVPTEPGNDIPELPPDEAWAVTLEQWEVLHLQAKATDGFTEGPYDLTGTIIRAEQEVAVWGGHDCLNVEAGNCDHVETQLAPLAAWGDVYVAARLATPAPNVYQVVSGADGTVVTTEPPIAGLDGVTLDEGEAVRVSANSSFVVRGSAPIQVVQFIAGNESGGDYLVDPSMAALVPTRQYRDDYPILVPSHYAVNRVAIVRPAGVTIFLDGEPLPHSSFIPASSGADWEIANVSVHEGVVRLTGDEPFGLIAYGYDQKVSYAYPAGFDASAAP